MKNSPTDHYAWCERTAAIAGPSSAAQKALDKFSQLKAEGENPQIVATENSWRVYYDTYS